MGSDGFVNLPDWSHSFEGPWATVLDIVRLATVVIGMYLIYMLAFSTVLSRAKEQRAINIAFLLAMMLAVWTQFERIGRDMSWRFPLVLATTFLGAWGVWSYLTAGYRFRDLRWRLLFIPPPPPPPPQEPLDMARRLRRDRAKAREDEAAGDADAAGRADARDARDTAANTVRADARGAAAADDAAAAQIAGTSRDHRETAAADVRADARDAAAADDAAGAVEVADRADARHIADTERANARDAESAVDDAAARHEERFPRSPPDPAG